MKYFILATIIFLGILPPAIADDIDFKGFPLGGKMEDFKRQFPNFNCSYVNISNLCTFEYKFGKPVPTYGDVSVSYISATFKENTLHQIHITIYPDTFDFLAKSLKGKYGKPIYSNHEIVQNGMGAIFMNQNLTWKRSNGEIWITKYSRTVKEGSINILSQEALQDLRQQIEKQRQAAPGDL